MILQPRFQALILLVLCVIGILLAAAGCASPRHLIHEDAPAPTADTGSVTRSISDGKTAIAEATASARATGKHLGRAQTIQERIDYKATIIQEYFNQ